MTSQTRATLKGYFETGDTPDEAQFANTIDSFGTEIRDVLHNETLSVAGNFDVSSISQDYDHLEIRALLRSDVSAETDNGEMYFNNDTTDANYFRGVLSGLNAVAGGSEADNPQISGILGDTAPANNFAQVEIKIFNYTGSHNKQVTIIVTSRYNATKAFLAFGGCTWESTAAINRITIQPDGYSTDNFVANSYLQIIGVKYVT